MRRRSTRFSSARPVYTWFRLLFGITASLPLLALTTNSYGDEGWRHWKTENQVSIHYRTEASSGLTEVRADTSVRCTLSAFINLLRDTENADKWLDRVKSVEELERYSATENLVEIRFKGFHMVAERWVQTRSSITQDENLQLSLSIHNQYQAAREAPGIQVRRLEALWTLTPSQDGQVHIRYQGIIDPDGSIPNWMARNLNLESAYRTFVNLRKRIQLPGYQQPKLPFITEP
ncbi:hypothetical protein GCM10011352_24000 [Marinobacterium zhoushanense]|uniref:START domain-containing protein n=1 Tax=Marinobacterium zhoushanense TaxID=1679163 RepID=A0ABQ1KHB0_9GAMM|nr:hypothetical protein [Marinobacterium zhoushanense]GGB97056.1 hypothetical protein GCM10011352_24000 [Marinobacterium zhoushanense]